MRGSAVTARTLLAVGDHTTVHMPCLQSFEGDFLHNTITGSGVYTWPGGTSYKGEVLRGLRHGYG